MLNRTTVTLISKTKTGTDDFNRPIYKETEIAVSGCVVGSPSADDVTTELNLSGKHVLYEILIPNGDMNDWTGREVSISGKRYRTIGTPVEIFGNFPHIPCSKRIAVERFE